MNALAIDTENKSATYAVDVAKELHLLATIDPSCHIDYQHLDGH